MNLVCSSPKFESNDQSSYFNIMPGSYMASDKARSPGYFEIKSKSSPVQTPYYDAVDCDAPFLEQLQLQHGQHNFQFNGRNSNVNNITNGINGNAYASVKNISITPCLPMTPGYSTMNQKFQDNLVTPGWVKNGSFAQKLPNMSLQRRQTLKPSSLPSVSKNKPYSMPGLSPFTPATSSFEEYSVDSIADSINQKQSSQNNILLLDLRPFSMFTANHIKSSLNICVPSTLLKRCSFSVDKITETLVSDLDKGIFREWTKYENIVLYDNDSDSLSESCPLFHLCKKFKSPACKAKVGYLKGGFAAFYSKYEHLCEKSVNGAILSSSTFPRKRSTISHKSGPFTCPTPIIEAVGVNPFFTNIRQNVELSSGITETIPVRLPEGVVFDKSQIPSFMREIVYGENAKMKLAESFQDIERAEQKRLQSLMLLNLNQATAENPYSISAGMEKGTKNRYNNIWPYDHARVKIGECKEGDCDYVNASYVQAKGCDKRYIATQGPLPATYDDFWKVVWEQNSRVIVMLTKEEEAGRIQCHRYWSDCVVKPCRYGSIELILISEASNNSKDNTIITRKFRLSHTDHPEIPAREITQLHFLGWPDFGIPDSPNRILDLIDTANFTQSLAAQQCESSNVIGPMIVHCSAGCGRTGAFCTIDSSLSLLNNIRNQGLDISQDLIQNVVMNFREQRLSMVQTLRQYVFCYEAVLWKLVGAA
ncbi:2558_t:CDS:2 [Funneliformis geosporum]|nr:2558_t:CDS:2 [Funneliformis geosporum]